MIFCLGVAAVDLSLNPNNELTNFFLNIVNTTKVDRINLHITTRTKNKSAFLSVVLVLNKHLVFFYSGGAFLQYTMYSKPAHSLICFDY